MTISVCMIVKNEEKVLARCLDSLKGLYDELIIVDTGSSDATKQIAARYTDKIYDFEWVDDFSAARNFAFSKATMDYIYSADADEVLDDENRDRFKVLKDNLMPEIEIVQMKYGNQLENGTVYNFDEEYRPKLFKRCRNFVWIEPVHETVRLDPVVFDSEIVITHKPLSNHASRDIDIFLKRLDKKEDLSARLWEMFARELFISGSDEEIAGCIHNFMDYEILPMDAQLHEIVCSVIVRAARILGDTDIFFKYATKLLAGSIGSSEVCYEMGLWYENKGDYSESLIWFYNAFHETSPIIRLSCGGADPLNHMADIYEKLGQTDQAAECRRMINDLGR
ncbi:MAG: glycosyltransferase family 2 protein [Lachnospiraceae bacterium]|nr:glycosyltransferase family 2 protein [Lachnospiraceae bacterium]